MKILFLGCGKMGLAILKNMINGLNGGLMQVITPENILIIKKDKSSGIEELKKYHVNCFDESSLCDLKSQLGSNKVDIVFIAVKPQDCEQAINSLPKDIITQNTIFISIAAGKQNEFFERILGDDVKMIRTMPNLPVSCGKGIIFYLGNKNIGSQELSTFKEVLSSCGLLRCLQREEEFDVATAIFGSGPAYIFYLQEIFAKIANDFGFEGEDAATMVSLLFYGSSLMSFESDKDFKKLKNSVASKGGTTAAALEKLEHSDLSKLFKQAIEAALARSVELGKVD